MQDGDVFLDYAATSAVRPERVIVAVERYLRDVGATPGRSGHRLALEAGRIAFRCRRALADLFGVRGDPGQVAFQPSTTHACNAALFGLLRPGDRVVRTAWDHNAVRRPLAALERRGVEVTVVGATAEGGVDLDEVEAALRGEGKPARLLAFPHASNVTGAALPVRELAERAHAAGALVFVDAGQSAGHLPIDVEAMGIDVMAFPGHKGLLGPQGIGGLYVRRGVEIDPVFSGGTGGDSSSFDMPAAMPDRLEAGSLNGPGIAGLLAGVEWVLETGMEDVHAWEIRKKRLLHRRLSALPGVRVRSPEAPGGVGIVTITADALRADELAARLDRDWRVMTRAGLHCAPEAHAALGTLEGGAVRFSIGWATTEEEIDAAAHAVQRVLGPRGGETPAPQAGS
jgi:cysteine desulfurase/selenocysteine lyase